MKKIYKVLYLRILMIQINPAPIMHNIKQTNIKRKKRKCINNQNNSKINLDFKKGNLIK